MKKQISILSLLLALMLLFTACANGASPSAASPSSSEEARNSALPLDAIPVSSSDRSGKSAYQGFTTSNIPGDIKNVYTGGGTNVLVTTSDHLYLYDLSQDAITATTETAPSERDYRSERYQPIQNGFAGLLLDLGRTDSGGGLSGDANGPTVTCVFYDSQLNKGKEINLVEALQSVISEDDRRFGIQELRAVDVSEDGSQIAVGCFSSLYVYDVKNGTGRRIISESQNLIFSDVRFAGNGRVAFGGAYLPAGAAQSSYAYGTVDADGGNFQIHTPQGFRAGELPGANDSVVLVGQDMRAVSGKLIVHPAAGEARTVELSSAKEGDMAFLSDGGSYFATSVNGEKLTIRVYDMEKAKLQAETSIAEDDEILICRVPDVRILDDLRVAVVIYGQHVDTRIKVIPFNMQVDAGKR